MVKKIFRAYGLEQPLVEIPHLATFKTRAPTANDRDFAIGDEWVYKSGADTRQVYFFGGLDSNGDAIWVITGPGDSEVDTLGCDAGDDPVAPSGGKIDLLGTANQIVTTGDDGASSITWSLSDALNIVTSLTVPLIIGDDAGSLNIKLGDNAGVDDLNILDSDDATVANIDSNGGANFVNLVTSGTTQTLGNSNTSTTVAIAGGTGGNTVSVNNGVNTVANIINLGAGAAAADSTVNILSGNATAGTQTLNVLTGNRAGALNLATGAAAHVIAIGSASAGAITVDTAAGISLDAATASNFTVTGASADLTLSSAGGSVNITASEAAADAIVINASDGAGGVEVQAGTGGILIGNQADCTTIDLGDFAPTASRTITIGGGTVVTASVTDTIDIAPDGATTNADSVKTVNINTGTLETGQVLTNIASGAVTSGTHTTAIATGNVTAGTVSLNISTGTGTKTINVGNADAGTTLNVDGVTVINEDVNANVSINTGTSTGTITLGNAAAGAISADTAAGISLDAATASNFTVTGASADLTLSSAGGSVNITASEAAADAIVIDASDAAGGIDIDFGSGGLAVDGVGGGYAITSNAASSVGVTGAGIDLTLDSAAGRVIVNGEEAAANAITLLSAAGGIDADAALQINIASSQDASDAIRLNASAGGIDIDATGEAGQDITITNTGGSIGIEATEATADAIVINASNAAGGIDLQTGGGEVSIDSSGQVGVTTATDSQSSPTPSSTINARVGAATFTGFTTASAGTQDFTITNSFIGTSSNILVTACNEGANDAQMTVTRVQRASGSMVVTLTNNGAAALNGNVIITFWVLDN